jgi:hypothetical protein
METLKPSIALDYSNPESWMSSHAAMSDALTAIAYSQPQIGMIGARWSFDDNKTLLVIERPRRARLALAHIALEEASPDRLAQALPGISMDEAESLASLLEQLRPLEPATLASTLDWAKPLGQDSLGLGCSARFDPHFPDGIERDGPQGLSEAERAFSTLASTLPALTQSALLVGARNLSGSAQSACEELLALFEADHLEADAPASLGAPSLGAPSISAPGRLGRRL